MAHDEDKDNKIAWIEAELCNNESASNQELKLYFLENGLDNETCDLIMAQRNDALKLLGFYLNTKGMKL